MELALKESCPVSPVRKGACWPAAMRLAERNFSPPPKIPLNKITMKANEHKR
jgi:hypothetical protein